MKTIAIIGSGPGILTPLIQHLMKCQEAPIERGAVGMVPYVRVGDVVLVGLYDDLEGYMGTEPMSLAASVDFERFFRKMDDGEPKRPGPSYILGVGHRVANITFTVCAKNRGEFRLLSTAEDYSGIVGLPGGGRKKGERRPKASKSHPVDVYIDCGFECFAAYMFAEMPEFDPMFGQKK